MARAPTGFPTSAPTFEHRIEAYSEKRAIVATPNIHSGGDPDDLNPTLYYNYGERAFNDIWPSMTTYVGIPFVPMINDRDLSYNFKIRPEILLGFNEPDMSTSAAYMEPAEAIQLWPQIEAKNAVRLGSPACTRRNMMNWLPSFMAGNGTYVPRVYTHTLFEYIRHIHTHLVYNRLTSSPFIGINIQLLSFFRESMKLTLDGANQSG